MILIIDGHDFHYEMEKLCRIFYPFEKIEVRKGSDAQGEPLAYTGVIPQENGVLLRARFQTAGKGWEDELFLKPPLAADKKVQERELAVLLYRLLVSACGYTPPWGILTGIRPVKLLRRLTGEWGEEEAGRYFREKLLVSQPKLELCRATMENEQKLLQLSRPDSFSLYVSIPFCPTRCSYCSFVSSSVEKTMSMIPQYVELLCSELAYTAKVARSLSLRLESVYIGGGTPTTLSAQQLAVLIETICSSFDVSACREFTVEAGRPDTITKEKLLALQAGGVTRISINPQTLNDAVLQEIGRRHTTKQTLNAYALARECGMKNINMDLIAGLPGDTLESFSATLTGVLGLSPENITLHTLSLKRSARLAQEGTDPARGEAALVESMLELAGGVFPANGYAPYYLYRQSRMAGNLENTGWAKRGFESCYNVYTMDETHTILACGAGAVSKIKDPKSDRLERIFNLKYPYEYISRHQEMLTRKERVKQLYEMFFT